MKRVLYERKPQTAGQKGKKNTPLSLFANPSNLFTLPPAFSFLLRTFLIFLSIFSFSARESANRKESARKRERKGENSSKKKKKEKGREIDRQKNVSRSQRPKEAKHSEKNYFSIYLSHPSGFILSESFYPYPSLFILFHFLFFFPALFSLANEGSASKNRAKGKEKNVRKRKREGKGEIKRIFREKALGDTTTMKPMVIAFLLYFFLFSIAFSLFLCATRRPKG